MLTQPRRLGWLFNPITIFFVWDDPTSPPVGVVLEVTNTPWHERIRYPVVFRQDGGSLRAEFDKLMHVSPFLDMDYRYRLAVREDGERIAIDLDVVDDEGAAVVETALRLCREPATRRSMGRSLWRRPLATHRVSAGIHRQAAHLWRKGVSFVRHPGRTGAIAR